MIEIKIPEMIIKCEVSQIERVTELLNELDDIANIKDNESDNESDIFYIEDEKEEGENQIEKEDEKEDDLYPNGLTKLKIFELLLPYDLTEKSKRDYSSRISNTCNLIFDTKTFHPKLFDDQETVIQSLDKKTDSYVRNSTTALSHGFKIYNLEFPEFLEKLKWDAITNINTKTKSKKDVKNLEKLNKEYDSIKDRLWNNFTDSNGEFNPFYTKEQLKSATFFNLQRLITFCLYGYYLPPIRNEWQNVLIDANDDKVNWIDTKNWLLHLNNVKNSKYIRKRSEGKNPILDLKKGDDELITFFEAFRDCHPNWKKGEHLFLSKTGKGNLDGNFTKYLNDIYFKGCSCNLLRKYYRSKHQNVKYDENEEFINEYMLHSPLIAKNFYKFKGLSFVK